MDEKLSYTRTKEDGRELSYHYFVEGKLCNTNDPEDIKGFQSLLNYSRKRPKHKIGDKIYTISFDEGYSGAYTMGWIIIFDIDRLFKEIFIKGEAIMPESVKEEKEINEDIIGDFLKELKEKKIDHELDFINMD